MSLYIYTNSPGHTRKTLTGTVVKGLRLISDTKLFSEHCLLGLRNCYHLHPIIKDAYIS